VASRFSGKYKLIFLLSLSYFLLLMLASHSGDNNKTSVGNDGMVEIGIGSSTLYFDISNYTSINATLSGQMTFDVVMVDITSAGLKYSFNNATFIQEFQTYGLHEGEVWDSTFNTVHLYEYSRYTFQNCTITDLYITNGSYVILKNSTVTNFYGNGSSVLYERLGSSITTLECRGDISATIDNSTVASVSGYDTSLLHFFNGTVVTGDAYFWNDTDVATDPVSDTVFQGNLFFNDMSHLLFQQMSIVGRLYMDASSYGTITRSTLLDGITINNGSLTITYSTISNNFTASGNASVDVRDSTFTTSLLLYDQANVSFLRTNCTGLTCAELYGSSIFDFKDGDIMVTDIIDPAILMHDDSKLLLDTVANCSINSSNLLRANTNSVVSINNINDTSCTVYFTGNSSLEMSNCASFTHIIIFDSDGNVTLINDTNVEIFAVNPVVSSWIRMENCTFSGALSLYEYRHVELINVTVPDIVLLDLPRTTDFAYITDCIFIGLRLMDGVKANVSNSTISNLETFGNSIFMTGSKPNYLKTINARETSSLDIINSNMTYIYMYDNSSMNILGGIVERWIDASGYSKISANGVVHQDGIELHDNATAWLENDMGIGNEIYTYGNSSFVAINSTFYLASGNAFDNSSQLWIMFPTEKNYSAVENLAIHFYTGPNSDIENVTLRLNGTLVGNTTLNDLNYTWNTYYWANGTYGIEVRASVTEATTPGHVYWINLLGYVQNFPDAPPSIMNCGNVTIEYGEAVHLWWYMTDVNPDAYVLYRDGVLFASNDQWESPLNLTVNLLNQIPGNYNYTLIANDTFGSENVSTLFVTVVNNPPVITAPSTMSIYAGTTGNVLTFHVEDGSPDKYMLYRDSVLIQNGSWTSPWDLDLNLDALSEGTYNFTLVVNDTLGLQSTKTTIVTVTTNLAPQVVSTDPDLSNGTISFMEDTYWEITFNITDGDGNGDHVWFEVNATMTSGLVDLGPWQWPSTNSIRINAYNFYFDRGDYNVTMYLNDTTGETTAFSFIISITNYIPYFFLTPQNSTVQEGFSDPISLEWSIYDAGDAAGTYKIYLNGAVADEGNWISGDIISYTIPVGTPAGEYNIICEAIDADGAVVRSHVQIIIESLSGGNETNVSGFETWALLFSSCIAMLGLIALVKQRQRNGRMMRS